MQEKVNCQFLFIFQTHLFSLFLVCLYHLKNQAIAKCWQTDCIKNQPIIFNHLCNYKSTECENRPNTDLVKEGKLLQGSIFSHCRYWQIFGTSQFHFLLLKEQAVTLKMLWHKYYQIPLHWHITALCKGWNSVFLKQWSSIAVSTPPQQSLSNDSQLRRRNNNKKDELRINSKERLLSRSNKLSLSRTNA